MSRERERTLEIGGQSKEELLSALRRHDVGMNEYAHTLFSDTAFTTSRNSRRVKAIEVSVTELGLREGGTSAEIFAIAQHTGLALCPLELAPRLRLEYLANPKDHISRSLH